MASVNASQASVPTPCGRFCHALVKKTGKPCMVWASNGGRCGRHRGKPEFKIESFECSICLSPCDSINDRFLTSCDHAFHRECVNRYRQTLTTRCWPCPLCRREQRPQYAKRTGAPPPPPPPMSEERLTHLLCVQGIPLADVIDEPVILRELHTLLCYVNENRLDTLIENSTRLQNFLILRYLSAQMIMY